MLREAGVATALVSDEPAVCQHPLASDFDEIALIDPPWQMQVAGQGQFEQTHLARCFLQIIDWLQSASRPFMLWCHLAKPGHDLGRPAGVSPAIHGRRRSAAPGFSRGARPPVG